MFIIQIILLEDVSRNGSKEDMPNGYISRALNSVMWALVQTQKTPLPYKVYIVDFFKMQGVLCPNRTFVQYRALWHQPDKVLC